MCFLDLKAHPGSIFDGRGCAMHQSGMLQEARALYPPVRPQTQPSATLITPLKTKSVHLLLLYNSNFSARECGLHSEGQHSGEDVTD